MQYISEIKWQFSLQQLLSLMEDLKCGFCHLGPEVKSICGKLHYDGKKLAAHHKCMVSITTCSSTVHHKTINQSIH